MVTGCSGVGPVYKVTSDSPARIERDGVSVCTVTPCKVKGKYYANGFGVCLRGANTHLEAFPLSKSGITQSKQAFGGCGKQYNVHFEMSSTKGIKTYEGNNRPNSGDSTDVLKSRLKKLDVLLKGKIISQQEHNNRRQQILNEI